MKKVHANVKCDCGHHRNAHYRGGFCDEPKCGCTWYHPNHKWIEKQKSKK